MRIIVVVCIALALSATALPTEDQWIEKSEYVPAGLAEIEVKVAPLDAPFKLAETDGDEFIEDAVDGWTLLDFDEDKYAKLRQHMTGFDEVTLKVGDHHLELSHVPHWKAGVKVTVVEEDGRQTEHEPQELITLAGKVAGDAESFASLTISKKGSYGFIHTSEKRYWLERHPTRHAVLMDIDSAEHKAMSEGMTAKMRKNFQPDQEPVIMKECDRDGDCHTVSSGTSAMGPPSFMTPMGGKGRRPPMGGKGRRPPMGGKGRRLLGRRTPTSSTPPTTPTIATTQPSLGSSSGDTDIYMALECDKSCVDLINGQGYSDVETYLRALTVSTSAVYKRDLGRTLIISSFRLHSNNKFGSSSDLSQILPYFGQEMNRENGICYDVAHLFTGSGSGGLAAKGTVCQRSRDNAGVSTIQGNWQCNNGPCTGVSASNWDLIVGLHEVGHNYGSPHTHSYNPPLDNCVACDPAVERAKGTCGGDDAKPVKPRDPRCKQGTIMSYCHLCGGNKNIDIKFSLEEKAVLKSTLARNCGPLPGESVEECTDNYRECSGWVSSGQLTCSNGYMSRPEQGRVDKICCSSCRTNNPRQKCSAKFSSSYPTNTPTKSTCVDGSHQCYDWVSGGLCARGYITKADGSRQDIKDICAKSCGNTAKCP